MKHILIGTAGHVDHGKTALIRALTGINTDRLAEEQSRGITIDIGFAYLPLSHGNLASIIDVPGHEKFIKNMLAGAGGIDFVLLVIASDDGVMPQTVEHLDILELLNAKDGIIVLTKCDVTDADWQDMVCEDIKMAVNGTFLEQAPIIRVSSTTGENIQALKNLIGEKITNIEDKNILSAFRLPVDRVFSVEGFGTVVTGTLIEGTLRTGDSVMIYPSRHPSRVRTLQVHSQSVDTAYAGQRVAVNLSGIARDEIFRGDTIAMPESIQNTKMMDVKLTMTKNSQRELVSGTWHHFYHGTKNLLCKVILIDKNKLTAADTAYAQLRFIEPISVKRGDTFILRFYSPLETIAGGVILNESPKKHRVSKTMQALKLLQSLEYGGIAEHIVETINQFGVALLRDVQKQHALADDAFAHELALLAEDGEISFINESHAIAANYKNTLLLRLQEILNQYHKMFPLQPGIKREELKNKWLPTVKPKQFDAILALFSDFINIHDARILLKDFAIRFTPEQEKFRNDFIQKLSAGYSTPSIDELLTDVPQKNQKSAMDVIDALRTQGYIIATEPGIIFTAEQITQAKEVFTNISGDHHGQVTLALFRDAIQTSRKYALSLLEYFDKTGFSKKIDDYRMLAKH